MSKIQIECYENDSEISDLTPDGSRLLTLNFNIGYNGYLSIGGICQRIMGRECTVDVSKLSDGLYTPKILLCDKTVILPTLSIKNGRVSAGEYDSDYVRELSLREKRLSQKLSQMERELEKIKEKVFGSSIF